MLKRQKFRCGKILKLFQGSIAACHRQRPGNLPICLSGQKILAIFKNMVCLLWKHSKILKSQEADRPWEDRTEQYASKKVCVKWSKYIRSRFQGLKEDQNDSISEFRQPSKLADKVNC